MPHDIANIRLAFVFEFSKELGLFIYAVDDFHKFMEDYKTLNDICTSQHIVFFTYFKHAEMEEVLEGMADKIDAYYPAMTVADYRAYRTSGEMPMGWFPKDKNE